TLAFLSPDMPNCVTLKPGTTCKAHVLKPYGMFTGVLSRDVLYSTSYFSGVMGGFDVCSPIEWGGSFFGFSRSLLRELDRDLLTYCDSFRIWLSTPLISSAVRR